jgi:ABC-type multidrug transport system fused ATPase/permease subunit
LKESNLLCGDAITNFKTVQSFGNEELIVKKYKEMMLPVFALSKRAHLKTGFAFGLSQFSQYLVFAAMFWFGGLIIKNSIDEETGMPTISPEDVFIALFAIMFGAS